MSVTIAAPSLSAITDEGATAEAIAAAFKLADDVFTIANSPSALALRQRSDIAAILAKMDSDLAEAQKTGDASQVAKDSSG